MRHVMLDLETLANRPDAAVLQIAALEFDPALGTTGAEFNTHVADFTGRHVDPGTVAWWLQQGDVAGLLGVALAGGRLLHGALSSLAAWFTSLGPVAGVWSHGLSYDIPILEHAYAQLGAKPPWGYKTPRDTRTIYALTSGGVPPAGVVVDGLTKHDALADCHTQVRQLCAALGILRAGGFDLDAPARAPA